MLKPSVESTSDPIAEEFVANESVVAVDTTVKEEQVRSWTHLQCAHQALNPISSSDGSK